MSHTLRAVSLFLAPDKGAMIQGCIYRANHGLHFLYGGLNVLIEQDFTCVPLYDHKTMYQLNSG